MTQDEWLAELDRLMTPSGDPMGKPSLGFDFPEPGSLGVTLVQDGHTVPASCDKLARWCFDRVGLSVFGITAPGWGASYRGSKEGKLSLAYWSLGVDEIGVYRQDPGKERGMWDRCYVIPDMPIPEENPPPKGLSLEDRRAWLEERRPRQQVLDALALWHLAKWLQKTPEDDR